ncbi:MAG: hypothetical protein NUV47_03530 [Patescibacteria group bacterium]|nr:hypothetical protein [Patescibacteria group bacterium]
MIINRDILILVLGWLFGLLSPIIVDAIRNRRESIIIKKALISELQEFRYRLMLNVYIIESKHGKLDHEFFEWAQTILSRYTSINSSGSLLKAIGPLLKLTKDEMASYSEMAKQQRKSNSGISLKKHSLSILNTNMVVLARFDSIFQSQLLEVRTRMGFLNEIADEARYYYKLSFQNGITSENYEIANTNMINSYKFYASQARGIILIIGKILNN